MEPLSTETVLRVIDEFAALQQRYNELHGLHRRGHINITGGEPFIREDIEEILDHLGSYRDSLSFGVLSNGSFLGGREIEMLRRNGAAFVQLSIDGDRKTHDELRAPGDFDRTFRIARHLEKRGVRVHISFTANRENFRFLPKVANICRRFGITKLWSDRLVPIGNGRELEELAITKELLPEYLAMLKKAQGNSLTRLLFPKTQVTANRALQFLGAAGNIYSCSAGKSLITVDEFGNILPCRRMPIHCGNILETALEEVYFSNDTFRALRRNTIPKACGSCPYSYYCRGGAKCQAYAVSGSFVSRDPGCSVPEVRF